MSQESSLESFENLGFPSAEDMMPSQAFSVTRTDTSYNNFDIDDRRTISSPGLTDEFSTRQAPLSRESNISQNLTNFLPPSPSDRWRNYLEAVRNNSSGDNIDTDTEEIPGRLSRMASSSSFDYIQTDDGRISHVRVNNPTISNQIRQPLGIPRFLGGKVCDPSNFKNGDRLLKFEVLLHDGSHISLKHKVQNVLRNDETVYCSLRGGVINILLKYAGYSETGCSSDTICSLSQIVFKSPERGYSWPCSSGLVFVSHEEISIESTRYFDSFTKELYKEYNANKETSDSLYLAGFFELNDLNSQKDAVILCDKPAKYVLVKLLTASCKGSGSVSSNVDLQYIGFVGRSGPRAIAAAAFR